MDVVLRFREDTRTMAEQILERGNGPGDVADFVDLYRFLGHAC